MRRALVLVHRWIGLALAAWILLLCLTGSVLVYRPELYRAFEPQPLEVAAGPALLTDEAIRASARRAFPGEEPAEIWRGREPNHAVEVDLVSHGETRGYLFDPYTGRPLRARCRGTSGWSASSSRCTPSCSAAGSGRTVNGALALGFVFLALTGALAWRPRRRAETRARTGLRRWHMTVGIWAALFALVWAVTGLHLAWPEVSTALVDHFEPFDELEPGRAHRRPGLLLARLPPLRPLRRPHPRLRARPHVRRGPQGGLGAGRPGAGVPRRHRRAAVGAQAECERTDQPVALAAATANSGSDAWEDRLSIGNRSISPTLVIPAKAGTQSALIAQPPADSPLRAHDQLG